MVRASRWRPRRGAVASGKVSARQSPGESAHRPNAPAMTMRNACAHMMAGFAAALGRLRMPRPGRSRVSHFGSRAGASACSRDSGAAVDVAAEGLKSAATQRPSHGKIVMDETSIKKATRRWLVHQSTGRLNGEGEFQKFGKPK
jgi:hypothetical protein